MLRAVISPYDGGLFLTMSRFLDWDRLLYRDLWTLYGPGPPLLGSLVMRLFGPGIGPQQVVLVLAHASMVIGVYLVARRHLRPWAAAALASFVAAIAPTGPFLQTLALLVWGLWFTLRASEGTDARPRRLLVASLLLGASFWGRFEFVPISLGLVVWLWYAARGEVDEPARRRALWLGLAPPVLFLGYIVAVVGLSRAWLNLVEYPVLRYPDHACRGLPDAWLPALQALAAPIRGELWTTRELMLWSATILAPALAILAVATAARRRAQPLARFVTGAIGVVSLVIWLEHRTRSSENPQAVIPLLVLSAAVVLGRRWTRGKGATAGWAAVAVVIALVLATSWVPPALRRWSGWPPYDARLGWEGGRMQGFYDPVVWSEIASMVRSRTAEDEEIFVALTDNSSRHHANAPIFYWWTDRPPASRFIEFDPCLTDTDPVQREIVRDIAQVDLVVGTTFFPDTRTPGSTILEGYLRSHFEQVYRGELPQGEAVVVLERRQ